jgi:hypothetical protein
LHRAGELTAIRVPAEAEEAVRDLVRARAALVSDRKRGQQRITAMLLRHGRVWRGTYWTQAHEQWIAGQRLGEPALAAALAHYRGAGCPPRGTGCHRRTPLKGPFHKKMALLRAFVRRKHIRKSLTTSRDGRI